MKFPTATPRKEPMLVPKEIPDRASAEVVHPQISKADSNPLPLPAPVGSAKQEPAGRAIFTDTIERILIFLITLFLLLTITAQCYILIDR